MKVEDALETLEQVAASGWYPARRELIGRLPAWVPLVDVERDAEKLIVSFALPGVDKADIRLQVRERCVTASGERRASPDRAAWRRELPSGPFLRRVHLPEDVKPQTAKAAHRDGVLTVTVLRAKPAAGRSVKIE